MNTVGTDESSTASWCPSGDAYAPESVVLGVRPGPDGQVAYLAEPVPAAEVLGSIPEGIAPTRVLRFASHCVSDCVNRRGDDCTLVERVRTLPPEQDTRAVPRCHLRTRCQWWRQTGVDACYRCPSVSTAHYADDRLSELVADPATTPEQLSAWIAEAG
ncbi:hypothetical protein [Streptomyces sp. SM11]|uniref:hypothetical protein n=1 Tax=Streptomyces sp. SM11 TaxID=565557 RepID=UPI00215624EF|nr:hypothetical protein [Streptomyces sp. SM11]